MPKCGILCMLEEFGLSNYEDRVYLTLLRIGESGFGTGLFVSIQIERWTDLFPGIWEADQKGGGTMAFLPFGTAGTGFLAHMTPA